jgi:hypothetical protein
VISKILLTLAVIGLAWMVIRNRQQSMGAGMENNPPQTMPKPPNRAIKWVGYGLLGVMLLGSVLYFAWQIEQAYRLVTVRVVDAQSGRSVSYIARRSDVGTRRFTTQDGLEVLVADGERIELLPFAGDRLP